MGGSVFLASQSPVGPVFGQAGGGARKTSDQGGIEDLEAEEK